MIAAFEVHITQAIGVLEVFQDSVKIPNVDLTIIIVGLWLFVINP